MLKEGINGFCMALADSVPRISGGTIAFIIGFYDRFIGAIHDLTFGKMQKKFFQKKEQDTNFSQKTLALSIDEC